MSEKEWEARVREEFEKEFPEDEIFENCPVKFKDIYGLARRSYLTRAKKDIEEIDKYKSMYEATELERKRYHREFCQERQRVIDSKPTARAEKELQARDSEIEKLNRKIKNLQQEVWEYRGDDGV